MDTKKTFELSLLGLIVIILGLHAFALAFFLYWKYWWFDILLHFLGGIFVGLFALYLYYYSRYIQPQHFHKRYAFFLSFATVALIGIMWEFFEFSSDKFAIYIGRREALQQGFQDTLGDLFFDLVGAIFAVHTYLLLWRKK